MAEHSLTPAPPRNGVLTIGQRVDKYIVRGPLAAGSWARVFEARHERLGSEVAIKVLAQADDNVARRFEQEARTAAGVRHRNVLEVYDVGNLDDGTPYLVMELLRGRDLAAELEDGPLSIEAAVDLARQLTAALVALAEAGIVHRDLKPQNIVLHHEGDEVIAKIVDFGVSKLQPHPAFAATASDSGILVGTPYYMSPEQVAGEPLDARSDLYSLGVVLYECLTGRLPFNATSVSELGRLILDESAPRVRELRPDCPKELEAIVMRLLEKNPSARHANARELATDLERFTETHRLATGPAAWAALEAERKSLVPVPPTVVTSDAGVRKWVVLAVVALAALLMAMALGWIGP